jgi:hypothetical protein
MELAKTPTNAATQTIYKIVQTGIRPAHRDKSHYSTLYYLFFLKYSLAKRGATSENGLLKSPMCVIV